MIRPETVREKLLKEAMQRIAPSERTYSFVINNNERKVACNLLSEAESRLQKIRIASLEKEGMAAQAGVKDIRNSTANTVFGQPITSEDFDNTENKLYESFSKWFYATVKSRHLPVESGMFIPETPGSNKFRKIPNCHLRIEFPFHRPILPTKKEYATNAENAVGGLERIIPNLGRFISELEESNVPVHPFFHSTVRKKSLGGVNSKEAIDFILSQVGKPMRMPNGEDLPISRSFYQEHSDRLNSGGRVQLTVQHNHNRRYDRAYAKDLNVPTYLLRAIEDKIIQGYGVDWKALKKDLREQMNQLIEKNDFQYAHAKTNQLSPQQRHEIALKKEAYVDYYSNVLKTLQDAFRNAIVPITNKDDPNEWTGIGGPFARFKMRGFRISGKVDNRSNKHVAPVDVSTMHLKLALFHMTRRILKGTPSIGPGEFTIPNNKMTYYSNGMDSVPTDSSSSMSVFPSLRRNASGTVTYDTDQCNLGRIHLVHNGQALESMLQRWGPWCDGALKVLMSNQKPGDDVADNAIQIIMSNRTNAETVIDILSQYRDYESFKTGFLSKSTASEFTGGRGLEETGTMKDSVIGPNGFQLLVQYGYQFSKMMDFISAIAHRSTEDVITNRMDDGNIVEEKFYGRNLSTATGKSENSTIIIGIRYANAAPRLASHDPKLQSLVDKHRQRGAISPVEGTEYIRQTRFPQRSQGELPEQYQSSNIYRVVHDLRFFVGLATSKANFKTPIGPDDYDTWEKARNVLLTHYPQIENEIGVLIEPMSVNLKEMSSRFKKALIRVQNDLKQEKLPIEIIVTDEVTHSTEVLDSAVIAAQEDITQQEESFVQSTSGKEDTELFSTLSTQPSVTPQLIQRPEEAAALPPETQTQPQMQGYSDEPDDFDLEEKVPAVLPKPMTGSDNPNYVSKRDTSQRNLIRHRPDPMSGKLQHASNQSLIEKLAQAADKLDKSGEELLAAKIDFLLEKLLEESNAHKER